MQIEGRNPVIELLKSKRSIKKIMIEQNVPDNPKIREILKRAKNRRIPLQEISRKKLKSISATNNHQGVIAISTIDFADLSELITEDQRHGIDTSLMYIRDAQLEDNIGAIARSVEAAGMRGIVIPPKMSLSPQMFRSSMGALANIKVIQESMFNAIKTAQKLGLLVVGIEVDTDLYYYEANLTGPVMFIIGGEDKPLSEPIRKKCDEVVKIPMSGKINSLNMSVAASIVAFDKIRQQNLEKSGT